MTDAILSPVFRQQFLGSNGKPIVSGKLYSYVAGSAGGANKDTYSSVSMSAVNANPVPLDSSGSANIWLDPAGVYLLVLKDSLGNTIWSVDQVKGSSGSDAAVAVIQVLLAQNTGAGLIGTLSGDSVQTRLNVIATTIAGNTSSIVALSVRVTNLETDVATLKNNAISGITGYTTWALLNAAFLPYSGATSYAIGNTVTDQTSWWIYINAAPSTGNAPPTLPATSNAYWTLKLQIPAGQLAEVPLTDAGTHTDPVVGGTVNNSGIFRWSLSPVGWQRLYDVGAVSAKTWADLAGHYANDATNVQVPGQSDVAARGSHFWSLQSAASASGAAAAVASLSPLNTNTFHNAYISILSTAQRNSDGTVTLAFVQGVTTTLPYEVQQAVLAGKAIQANMSFVSGVTPTAGTLYALDAAGLQIGAAISMVANGYGISYVGTVPTNTMSIAVRNDGGTATFNPPSYAIGTGKTADIDNTFLARQIGVVEQYNQIVSLTPFYPLSVPTGFIGVLNIPAGMISTADLKINYIDLAPLATGTRVTVKFKVDSDLELSTLQSFGLVYGGGNAAPAIGHTIPVLQVIGDGYYEVTDYIDPPAGSPCWGFRITYFNGGARVFNLSDFQCVVGSKLPTQTSIPAVVAASISSAAKLETSYGQYTRQVYLRGDSTIDPTIGLFAPGANFDQYPGQDYYFNLLGAGRIRTSNLGASGSNVTQFLYAGDILPITVNVVGGIIPAAATSFEITSWSGDPLTLHDTTNPQNLLIFNIGGVDCTVITATTTWTGVTGATPLRIFCKRLVAGAFSITVPNGSPLIVKQGRMSAKNCFTFFCTTSANGNYGTGDGAVYTAIANARWIGRSAAEIADTQARWAFCPSLVGTPNGVVPGAQNVGSTAAIALLTAAGCPVGNIFDINAPQGAAGTGTGGGANKEYLSAAEKTFLTSIGYVLPAGGSTNDLQQKRGYRSDDLAISDHFHPERYFQALQGYRKYQFALFQAYMNSQYL